MTERDEWDDKPRKMWVWDHEDMEDIKKRKVVFVKAKDFLFPVIAVTKADGSEVDIFRHCSDNDPRNEITVLNKKLSSFEKHIEESDEEFEKGGLSYLQKVLGRDEGARCYICCSYTGNYDYSLEEAIDFFFKEVK